MPWTMNDYPDSLKNLNQAEKKKSIDIANALVEEGYDEGRAIPIATKQAEEWYKKASEQQRKDYLEKGEPTKHDTTYASRPELMDKAELVIPDGSKWAVRSKDAKKAAKLFDKKNEAIEYGKSIAENQGTKLEIYRKDETLEKTYDF